MKKAAILIDAGFFMQRVHATHRKHFAEHELTAQCIMKVIWSMVLSHLNGKRSMTVHHSTFKHAFHFLSLAIRRLVARISNSKNHIF